jgi:hypothetical protein
MSFWGGDETIYVSSVIYQLGEELDEIPDIIKATVIGSGMRSEPRSPAIKKSVIDGKGIKMRQAYAYAAKSYYAGMPYGIPKISTEREDDVVVALITEFMRTTYAPTPITILEANVESTDDYNTVIRQYLEDTYNYDFIADKVLTTTLGIPADSTVNWVSMPIDDVLHDGELGYTFTFTKPDESTEDVTVWLDEDLFAGKATIEYRLLYVMSIDGGPNRSYSYKYGDGSASINLYLKSLTTPRRNTFPAIVLKKKNRWIDDNKFYTKLTVAPDYWRSQPAWRTSRVYCNRMGINMKDLIKLVKESPDENKIDYVFVQPGTIISSPNLCAHEYHFNYFNRLRLTMPDNKPAFDEWRSKIVEGKTKRSNSTSCPAQYVHIYDPETADATLNMKIAWRYMEYQEVEGTIADKFTVECGAKDSLEIVVPLGRARKKVQYEFTPVWFRKRLTDTTYAELKVVGLWHENYVYKGESVKSGIWDAFNDPDGDYGTGFLIPLDWEILNTLSAREQLQLAQENTHIVFNCYKVVKEKWYQTGIFKVVLIIISVVVIIISWGAASPYVTALNSTIYGSLTAVGIGVTVAAAVAAVITALIVVGVMVAVQLVAKAAGEWAAEHWGPVWGAIVQIAVTIILTWGIGQLGQFAYPNIAAAATPMALGDMVVVGVSYVMSALATYTEFAMQQFRLEANRWQEGSDARDAQMQQLQDLWEEHFPEMSLPAQIWFMPRESLDEFLIRTLPGVDTLTNRLTAHIEYLSEITLTPKYL